MSRSIPQAGCRKTTSTGASSFSFLISPSAPLTRGGEGCRGNGTTKGGKTGSAVQTADPQILPLSCLPPSSTALCSGLFCGGEHARAVVSDVLHYQAARNDLPGKPFSHTLTILKPVDAQW